LIPYWNTLSRFFYFVIIAYPLSALKSALPPLAACALSRSGTQTYLPFVRRSVVEIVLPGDEGIAWRKVLVGLCTGFGLRTWYLDRNAIEGLTCWVLNPNLEY
jgi:hypothetical protein